MNEKKTKQFDAVRLMREIRDRISEELKGKSPSEQIEYMEEKSGIRREKSARKTASSEKISTTR